MNGTQLLGVALTGGGVVGYAVGLAAPYAGRSFSVTAVMVGITLLAIGNATEREASP